MQLTKMDHSIPVHNHILTTMYKQLTKSEKSVAATGGHWEPLGFQGSDPGTDLRAAGMFALLQLSYLTTMCSTVSQTLYNTAIGSRYSFPFALVSINMTAYTLDMYKQKVIMFHVKRVKSPLQAVNEYYVGSMVMFHKVWCSAATGRTISEWDGVRRELFERMKKKPKRVFAAYRDAMSGGSMVSPTTASSTTTAMPTFSAVVMEPLPPTPPQPEYVVECQPAQESPVASDEEDSVVVSTVVRSRHADS